MSPSALALFSFAAARGFAVQNRDVKVAPAQHWSSALRLCFWQTVAGAAVFSPALSCVSSVSLLLSLPFCRHPRLTSPSLPP